MSRQRKQRRDEARKEAARSHIANAMKDQFSGRLVPVNGKQAEKELQQQVNQALLNAYDSRRRAKP